jgi:hypothetical protein
MHRDNEIYVIDLCDRILNMKAYRWHRFEFLLGDPNKNGRCAKLPVDAYYPVLSLVVEYHERQHSESVPLFDKKVTISGMTRDEQRRRYDQRRREILPQFGIKLVEIKYSDFDHDAGKRILRNENDEARIRKKLQSLISEIPI